MKILVVEDEPILRENIAMLLEIEGHTVFQAENGQVALNLLSADLHPDIVFTDIKMPHMTGLELIANLRAGNFPEYPIVICSAYALSQDKETAEKLGVHKYLTKPFSFDEIIKIVEEIPA